MNPNNPNFRKKGGALVDNSNPKDRAGSAKVSLTRVPLTAQVEFAKAGMYGNFMYDPFNWRDKDKAIRLTVYIDAILRHALRLMDGEDVDPDSLVSHWGHIGQGSAVAIDAISLGNFVDDRPPKGKGIEYLDKFMADYPALLEHWQKIKDKKAAEKKQPSAARRNLYDDTTEIGYGSDA